LPMDRIKAVFISHEHIDHIRGVRVLAKKYQLPVYITPLTYKNARIHLEKKLQHSFKEDEPVQIGELAITPFVKHHDAEDPYSFIIEGNGVRVGVITDIGIACERVVHYFKQCHACFLESNYDEKMLEEGSYPVHLKKRICGGKGHISNVQALHLFMNHRSESLSHLLLSHLSKNNNHPELVQELFTKHAGETNIIIASRYKETAVFTVEGKPGERQLIFAPIKKAGVQMTLFNEMEFLS